MSNVIKFSPAASTITVRIWTDHTASGATQLHVSVADHGIGIPLDELDVIFDKFVQSSKTRSGTGGTGLGLSICREIIALHGGTIAARNRADGGASLEFVLPRLGQAAQSFSSALRPAEVACAVH